MRGTFLGLVVGLVLGAAGVGYAATTNTITAKAGDKVSAPGHITCLVARTNVSCAPRTGYFAVVGAKGVIVFTTAGKPVVYCLNGSACGKP